MATWTSSRKSSLCQSIVYLELGLPKAVFSGLTPASMEPQALRRPASAKHQTRDGLKEREASSFQMGPIPCSFLVLFGPGKDPHTLPLAFVLT